MPQPQEHAQEQEEEHLGGLHQHYSVESLLEHAQLATSDQDGFPGDSSDTQLLVLPGEQWRGGWPSFSKPLRPPCEPEAAVLKRWQRTADSKVPGSDAEQCLSAKGLAGEGGSAAGHSSERTGGM